MNLCTSFYKVCGPHNSTLAENLAAEQHQTDKIKGLSLSENWRLLEGQLL